MTLNEDKKILVVEDETRIRDVICMYLKKDGYSVLQTDNGRDALFLVEKEKPHLVVLDIMLPGLSGLEVCKTLKSGEESKSIIVFILSAKGQEWEKTEGYKVGADYYGTKPFSPKKLLAKIEEFLA